MKKLEPSYIAEYKMVHHHCRKQFGSSSKELAELPRGPAPLLLCTHPKGVEKGVYTITCTPMFTAAIFRTDRAIQPRGLSKEGWIHNTYMCLYNVLLLTINKQSADTRYNMGKPWKRFARVTGARNRRPRVARLHLCVVSRTSRSMQTERRVVVDRGSGERRVTERLNGVSSWDENVLEIGSDDGYTTLWIYEIKPTELYILNGLNDIFCKKKKKRKKKF